MIYLMLLPRADTLIYDHVSKKKKKEKVDNLPLGFALPVGMLEAFGDLLTAWHGLNANAFPGKQ